MIRTVSLSWALIGALALGCSTSESAGGDPGEPGQNLGVSCEGKCDGWGSITALWRDAKKLDLGDLLSVGAGFASDGLNDALSISDYAGIKLGEPMVYATAAKAQNDLTLGNLDNLATGLAVAYGERELTTEVNQLRRDHLHSSGDTVYGEFAFQTSAAFGHKWGLSVGGLGGASVALGFDLGANLTTRVIAPFQSEAGALGGAPLAALKGARGFVMPRSVNDVRAMKPGELLALSGSGGVGLNLGVGVPLLVATPAAIVVSALMVPGAMSDEAAIAIPRQDASAMDAITRGTGEGAQLLIQIVAMLIVLIALVHLVNAALSLAPAFGGEPLTLQRILGWLFAPLAWTAGVPWEEARAGGALLGTKTILNEFVAYVDLAKLPPEAMGPRSRLLMTYAMCGFANLGSLGILIGGMGAMVPERRGEIVSLGMKSIVAGTLATCLTAAVVGLFV